MSVFSSPQCFPDSTPQNQGTGLLSLPIELRLHIYEYVLADVQTTVLRIVKDSRGRWRLRRPRIIRVPSLVLINKTIRAEAEDVLFRRYTPTIRIFVSGMQVVDAPFVAYRLFCPSMLLPMLRYVPILKLEVAVSDCGAQIHILTVLRWLREVLDNRTQPIRNLMVEFRDGEIAVQPKDGELLLEALKKKAYVERGVVKTWRAAKDTMLGSIRLPIYSKKCGRVSTLESKAWKAMVEDCRPSGGHGHREIDLFGRLSRLLGANDYPW